MQSPMDTADRIAELKHRDAKIKELTAERDAAQELVNQMREQVEDANQLIEQWIEAFHMTQNEKGLWCMDREQSEFFQHYDVLWSENHRLIRQWNKFVGEYNAVVSPRERGRPLAASKAQQADVLKRHKARASLRAIAAATSLSLRTVRTIVEKAGGRDRTSKRTNDVRRKEFDRLRAADYRARKKSRDRLPQQIGEQLKTGAELVKAAKGLGR
jgi:hypothetical protein